ncbi:metal-dependent hydrolase [Glaciimonas soli]|uniref:Metal-dependent hydrolase n=1 Tax=Glaciimonas soli TaxID=2590999 RepID=A0A843YQZ7_9BURK|nr:metal-dependent hydrolase [Glaciimonas soli]MQQ99701.1 metal-dependent hydrolase [Glaciimonas soli]
MASKEAHQSTGWAAGLIAAAIVSQASASGPLHVWSILAFLMGYAGGGAPDWLELSWWSSGRGRHSWISHRTVTHWGIAWIALLVTSYYKLRHSPVMALPFGFAAGGIMHLLADWPNPLGVPWLWVSKRHSLNWWKSGRADWIIMGAAWMVALVMADRVWFHSTGIHAIEKLDVIRLSPFRR